MNARRVLRQALAARWCRQHGHSPVIEQRTPADTSLMAENGLDVQAIAERLVCDRCDKVLMEPTVQDLLDRLSRLVTVAGPCEVTTGPIRCFHKHSGRHFNARYGADDYCLPCKVYVMVHGQPVSWELFVS